jgi:alpha-galactosidase
MRRIVLATVALMFSMAVNAQKFENMAPTPPMGWNSWNYFACNVDEKMIREVADIMAESGMQDAGYEYINIDDCWHGTRDSLGFIHPDPERFPSGMKALADYVHSKGLKLEFTPMLVGKPVEADRKPWTRISGCHDVCQLGN